MSTARRQFHKRTPAAVIAIALCAFASGCTGLLPDSASPSLTPIGPPATTTPSTPSASATAKPKSFAELIRDSEALTVRIETTQCGRTYGSGSGFLIAPDLVATVAHVVVNASTVSVRARGGTTGPYHVSAGTVIGLDADREVALIRLSHNMSTAPGLRFASASPVEQDPVAVIGYPGGRQQTTSQGSVRSVDRRLSLPTTGGGTRDVTGLIQLDADVSAGDSGGPVINRHGQVIGLVEAEYPDDKGLNYATSAKTAGPLITAWTSSPQVATTTCPTPDGRVEVKSRHPDAPGIAVSVLHYLIGINFGNHPATASGTTGYQLAYAVLSGQMKAKYQSLTDFENAQEGNVFSDVVVEKAAWKSDVKDTVDVSYRLTHTDPGESTATCEIDHVEYVVRLDSGVWTFDEVKELGVPASPKTC